VILVLPSAPVVTVVDEVHVANFDTDEVVTVVPDTSVQMLSSFSPDFQSPPVSMPEHTSSTRAERPVIGSFEAAVAAISIATLPELSTGTSMDDVAGVESTTEALVLAIAVIVTTSFVVPKSCFKVCTMTSSSYETSTSRSVERAPVLNVLKVIVPSAPVMYAGGGTKHHEHMTVPKYPLLSARWAPHVATSVSTNR
jgi:hypothetical protein